jgi:hypothetical protein
MLLTENRDFKLPAAIFISPICYRKDDNKGLKPLVRELDSVNN